MNSSFQLHALFRYSKPSLYNKLYKVQLGATYDSFKED